ncbi:hypothetical protein [Acaryochloris sp. IP29b_bin.137]|uniref:hypothetical protein n=1 Tax=Acaryochloris sp. IP29b_bin.137 TaxID=2969217 RepID=UPI002625788F|nr:hypothetical protein [Acaryochloris sp. IP29b_bin.137]
MTQISIYCFPVGINSVEIRSFTFNLLHWNQRINWHDIQKVKSRTILGLRYLVISGSKKCQIYVPLFLSKQHQFEQELKDLLEDSNPLFQALL